MLDAKIRRIETLKPRTDINVYLNPEKYSLNFSSSFFIIRVAIYHTSE